MVTKNLNPQKNKTVKGVVRCLESINLNKTLSTIKIGLIEGRKMLR